MALQSKPLDSNFRYDYEKMRKLNLTSDAGMRHFHQFVSDVFNYLIQPTLQSYRYNDNRDQIETKDIEYFYDLSASADEFLANEPSFFRFVDYMHSLSSKNDTQQLVNETLGSWSLPEFKVHEDLSCATGHDCEIEERQPSSISSCYSPVLFDKQSRAWYEAVWNAFFIAATGVKLNDGNPTGSWRVSPPVINMRDEFFDQLKDAEWQTLSTLNFKEQYLDKEYWPIWDYSNNQPFTRYCQSYEDVMYADLIFITRQYQPMREWEQQHMSEIAYSFWQPITQQLGKTLPDFPVDSQVYFSDYLNWDEAVGGRNTYNVGMDTTLGWSYMNPAMLSSFSWLSKPWRTYQFEDYQWRGQCQFETYNWQFDDVREYTKNPRIKPPLKPIVENIYALAYLWDKFLACENYETETKKFISHATAQQYIPYFLQHRDQDIICDWSVTFDLSNLVNFNVLKEDLSVQIGKAHCSQSVVSNDTGWISSDVPTQNHYEYHRRAGYGNDGSDPTIADYLCYDYGDLSGKCYYNPNVQTYFCRWDDEVPDECKYANQMKLLFPKSKQQQKQDDLEALDEEYLPQIDALSAEVDALSDEIAEKEEEIDELSALSIVLENQMYEDAYKYAWENVYNHDDISKLSDFFDYYSKPPYLNFVSGNFDNVDNWDFLTGLLKDVREYLSSQPELSGCPIVYTMADLQNVYWNYLVPNPYWEVHINSVSQTCHDRTEAAIEATKASFMASLPSPMTKSDVMGFEGRLNGANNVVGGLWSAWLHRFITDYYEEYFREYYNKYYELLGEIAELLGEIEELLEELEALIEEYEKKKKEIEEKEYTIHIPEMSEIDLLYNIYKNPYATIVEGFGFNNTYRNVTSKIDMRDGLLSSVEYYQGLDFRYPLSYSDDKNKAVKENAYLIFEKYDYELVQSGHTTKEVKVKPVVDDEHKDYDSFRKELIPTLPNEFKQRLGYSTRENWFGAEYSAGELDDYIIDYETQITCTLDSPIGMAITETDEEVEVNFNGETWMAQVLLVNSLYNYELGVGTYGVDSTIMWEKKPKFKESPPSKIETGKTVTLKVDMQPQIMCQTEWQCQGNI